MHCSHTTFSAGALAALGLALLLSAAPGAKCQNDPARDKDRAAAPAPQNRMTIEVTGGDANKPIENASVYVKTVESRAVLKDKKTELNVKTNMSGVAHIPEAPAGRVLIQVVAEGWKTYGHWYEIADTREVIKIHLERPPKWY